MLHTTLLGRTIEVETDPALDRLYDRILASASGRAAEDLAYGTEVPIPHTLTEDGLPIWTAEALRDPRWVYLQDAVARCRAACGELDVGAVMRAATWDVAEAARSLGVSEACVRKAIGSGEIPSVMSAGRHMLDRRVVEAHSTTGTRAGKTERVPALYARMGRRGPTSLLLVVLDAQGFQVEGELLSSVDGVDTLVFTTWAEAAFLVGKVDGARAFHVRPAHSRATSSVGLDGLEVRGRWEIVDKTNNRVEAVALYGAVRQRVKGGAS